MALYRRIINLGDLLQPYLLFFMRLYWGYAFFEAGWVKLHQMGTFIGYLGSLGIPYPKFMAPPDFMGSFVAWIECIGGLCLLFGLASRLVCIPLALIMIAAMFTTYQKETFGMLTAALGAFGDFRNFMDRLASFIKITPFNFFLICLIVFSFGPGKISIDSLIKNRFLRKKKG